MNDYNFTDEEVRAAKAVRDEITNGNEDNLKSIYMAGEIVMWDEMKFRREKEEILEAVELNKSGYAGILPDGRLVDRRLHPEAVPVQGNERFGVVEPKSLDTTKETKENRIVQWVKDGYPPIDMNSQVESIRSLAFEVIDLRKQNAVLVNQMQIIRDNADGVPSEIASTCLLLIGK